MLKHLTTFYLLFLTTTPFLSSFLSKNLSSLQTTVESSIKTSLASQAEKLDKYNPFTPDKTGVLLKNCDYKFNPKKIFPKLPVEDMICMPRHVEFGRKKIGAFAIWIFFCEYKSKVLDSDIILRINADLSMGQLTSFDNGYLRDDKNFGWLIGTDKDFLLANLLEADSMRCNQVKRILDRV